MRFCLFGQGEGVRSASNLPHWASVCGDVVTDASVSARKRGVRPGMPVKTAQALLPSLTPCPEEPTPTETMQAVWRTLWSSSPWLETVDNDSFYLQIPGSKPPLQEVREILSVMDSLLTEEQRFRCGFAENPLLARTLVEWSRVERVREALYRNVGRQQLIVSPGLSQRFPQPETKWFQHVPIRAAWMLPTSVRDRLMGLGIERLYQLEAIPLAQLQAQFGKESLLWLQMLYQEPGGAVHVNYPPLQWREVWEAAAGEGVRMEQVADVAASLVKKVAGELERQGVGALSVGMAWVTDEGTGIFERTAQRPLHQFDSLWAQLSPGLERFSGRCLERLEVYAQDIRPLSPIQLSFAIHKGALVSVETGQRRSVRKLLAMVNRKFPHRLRVGASANFRELRYQALTSSDPQTFRRS